MGVVHLARMEGWGFEKLVALKTLQRNIAEQPRARAMFLDEIRIAARISHPHVVGILEAGETEAEVWVAMELVRGASLRQLARVPLDEEWARRWPLVVAHVVADACEGLHAAHELTDDGGRPLQIVHRDVSPSNLVVGYDGIARVLDFGVASAVDRVHRTMSGQFRGKVGYASPEHLEGKPLDRRADVWSIGVLMWEALTRRPLFPARSLVHAIEAIGSAPIPPLNEALAESGVTVPRGLDEAVTKCLQRDLSRRFPTTRALGDELRLVLAEELDVLGPGDVAELVRAVRPNLPLAPTDPAGPWERWPTPVVSRSGPSRGTTMPRRGSRVPPPPPPPGYSVGSWASRSAGGSGAGRRPPQCGIT